MDTRDALCCNALMLKGPAIKDGPEDDKQLCICMKCGKEEVIDWKTGTAISTREFISGKNRR